MILYAQQLTAQVHIKIVSKMIVRSSLLSQIYKKYTKTNFERETSDYLSKS